MGAQEKRVVVQPVVFRGLVWGSPGKPGGQRRRLESASEVTEFYRSALPEAEVREALIVNGPEEAERLPERLSGAEVLIVHRPELLSVTWAVKALESLDLPVALFGHRNFPGAVLCDIYGYLKAAGRGSVLLALDTSEIERLVRAARARKMLSSSTVLVIGEGFPSWSQVANPTSPETVRERFGAKVETASVEELFERIGEVDRSEAESLAKRWLEEASEVKPEARNAIVEAAMTHLAIERLVEERGADGVAVDCRLMDELSMERYGTFYSPCMSLTVLRARGIHAACEADVCALLSMMALGYLADRPTFMGNIGPVSVEEGWLEIAHCAATTNMDGYDSPPGPLVLLDYHNRGTGVATFSRMREGQTVTFARFDKDLKAVGAGAGRILDSSPGRGCVNRIKVGPLDVRRFLDQCMAGDHHAVVYGDLTEELRLLCGLLGIEPLIAA